MRKDLNILVDALGSPLKKDEIVRIYSRSSEYMKVHHSCHSFISLPSVTVTTTQTYKIEKKQECTRATWMSFFAD